MRKTVTRIARRAGAIGALVVASILFALPAHALGSRTLPGSESLFALDNETSIGTLYTLDAQTGAPTSVGDPCAPCGAATWDANSQGAYNPVSGSAYWVGYGATGAELIETDLSSGTPIAKGNFDDGSTPIAITSIAIDESGNAYGFDSSHLFSINLNNAQVTQVGVASLGVSVQSFAYNPADHIFYAMSIVSATNVTLYSVNVDTGALSVVVPNSSFPPIELGEKRVMTMAFDSSGQLWGIDAKHKLFSIASVSDLPSGVELVGAVPSLLPHTIFIQYTATGGSGVIEDPAATSAAGARQLAETGSDSAMTTAIALGAMAVTGTGIALILRARRRIS